jgi:hypothetical protein
LYVALKAKSGPGEEVRIHSDVILGSTLWKIARVEGSVPEFNADLLARAEPVVRPDQFALCRTSDPGSDEASIVVVSAVVLAVVINAYAAERRRVGVSAFESEIQLGNSREFCEVESSLGGIPP